MTIPKRQDAQAGSVVVVDPDTVMREYAAAWGRGDPAAAFAFYGDDIVMHLPGRGSLGI